VYVGGPSRSASSGSHKRTAVGTHPDKGITRMPELLISGRAGHDENDENATKQDGETSGMERGYVCTCALGVCVGGGEGDARAQGKTTCSTRATSKCPLQQAMKSAERNSSGSITESGAARSTSKSKQCLHTVHRHLTELLPKNFRCSGSGSRILAGMSDLCIQHCIADRRREIHCPCISPIITELNPNGPKELLHAKLFSHVHQLRGDRSCDLGNRISFLP
jgi:hypothetical protein